MKSEQLLLDFDKVATKPRTCRAEHCNLLYIRQMILGVPVGRRSGFVYAGRTRDGLIKVGKTIDQCPLCRMDQNRLAYIGICFSEDACTLEQTLLTFMGTPVKGHEWFVDDGAIKQLLKDGVLHDVKAVNEKLMRSEMFNTHF